MNIEITSEQRQLLVIALAELLYFRLGWSIPINELVDQMRVRDEFAGHYNNCTKDGVKFTMPVNFEADPSGWNGIHNIAITRDLVAKWIAVGLVTERLKSESRSPDGAA